MQFGTIGMLRSVLIYLLNVVCDLICDLQCSEKLVNARLHSFFLCELLTCLHP